MTASVQDDIFDVLDAVADDESLPIKGDSRDAVRVAINLARRKHGGRVSSGDLREFYPPWIVDKQIGPTLRRLKLRGWLIEISHNARYGSRRNGDKLAPVYRVDRPIPAGAVNPGRTRRPKAVKP
ncbi:hypothetical protein OEB99_16715 [Actinotalea sp. M2MS4P-6]|uniref:hypothetical protein n=1 Tax=Actinotalea sp. M2MS4P-6 TaxID=2983762 RepID=UPI0021E4BA74|nr:hypothetical protein [Actinotalea sp. M2MS4P-6]MCV2395960.1 hypothetical protein [Actinotalea sp. M2MS4P-6]